MHKILIIEDNFALAKSIKDFLGTMNYSISIETSGLKAMKRACCERPDLILLDVMLTDTTGFEVASYLRTQELQTPIIILSQLYDTQSIVQGIEAGADNYLAKPFSLIELKVRIDSCLQRPPTATSTHIGSAHLQLQLNKHSVSINDTEVKLRKKELLLLSYLVKNQQRAVSRSELFNYVWGAECDRHPNILDVYVSKLRRKLGDPNIIKTLHSNGFTISSQG